MKISKYLKFIFLLVYVFFIGNERIMAADDYITVYKKNVRHKFARIDPEIDHFTQHIFWNWKNETFDVFDQVKDKECIAIDIGAGIGTTSIWLSKNFHHVLSVESDRKSLNCLEKNLGASSCPNVSICDKIVSSICPKVNNDEIVQSITFKQLVYDYLLVDNDLISRRISFIKCDTEREEEDILEDVLHFAYYNKCKVLISFHINNWKSKQITDFDYLFKFFKTNCPLENVCEYLTQHHSATLLFEPIDHANALIKKNLTAVIIGYNQLTFIKNMVNQLEKYTSDIIVVDNKSQYQPLLDYYQNEFKYTLLKQSRNFGHSVVWYSQRIQKVLGDIFVLTDPDLQFNPNLPDNFLQELIDISNYFKSNRVGFALLIDSDDIRTDITLQGQTIKQWESVYWVHRQDYPPNPNLEMYYGELDTTFCIVNKRYSNFYPVRVAGSFTCVHIPWMKDFQEHLESGEYESYLKNNISTHWFKVSQKD